MKRRFLLAMLPLMAGCTALTTRSEQPRIVFFNEDSARLDDQALLVLDDAAAQARSTGAPVQVLGYADPEGGQRYNAALSRARAEHVAQMLRERGVAAERITVGARGPVPFDLVPIESRRVEIRVGN